MDSRIAQTEGRLFDGGVTISHAALLEEREARYALKQSRQAHGVILTLTLNIPGPVKSSPRIEAFFMEEVLALEPLLPKVKETCLRLGPAGPFKLWLFSDLESGQALKAAMLAFETTRKGGALLDLDVLDAHGQVKRQRPRPCLLCTGTAKDCARAKRHPLFDLQEKVQSLVFDSSR